jgi:hypothetical protein
MGPLEPYNLLLVLPPPRLIRLPLRATDSVLISDHFHSCGHAVTTFPQFVFPLTCPASITFFLLRGLWELH